MNKLRSKAALALTIPALTAGCSVEQKAGNGQSCDPGAGLHFYTNMYPGDKFRAETLGSQAVDGTVTILQEGNKPKIDDPVVVRCGRQILYFIGVFVDGQKIVIGVKEAKNVRLTLPSGRVSSIPAAEVTTDSVAPGIRIEQHVIYGTPFMHSEFEPSYTDGSNLYGVAYTGERRPSSP